MTFKKYLHRKHKTVNIQRSVSNLEQHSVNLLHLLLHFYDILFFFFLGGGGLTQA